MIRMSCRHEASRKLLVQGTIGAKLFDEDVRLSTIRRNNAAPQRP